MLGPGAKCIQIGKTVIFEEAVDISRYGAGPLALRGVRVPVTQPYGLLTQPYGLLTQPYGLRPPDWAGMLSGLRPLLIVASEICRSLEYGSIARFKTLAEDAAYHAKQLVVMLG